ncbi:MAG: DMT family transporter [Candidatus Riflebacteria bacterium]|nr:DMT family transporter [Candidatus Riflebacteria bacterium]
MRAEIWAVLTAFCWAFGSFLEKRGVKLGEFAPIMGTTIRTTFSFIFLSILSYPYWGQLKSAGVKPVSFIAVGGGILAGGFGIICLYSGLKAGNISTVMTIAFCLTPVIGTIIGYFAMNEKLSALQYAGICLCIVGSAITVYFKDH